MRHALRRRRHSTLSRFRDVLFGANLGGLPQVHQGVRSHHGHQGVRACVPRTRRGQSATGSSSASGARIRHWARRRQSSSCAACKDLAVGSNWRRSGGGTACAATLTAFSPSPKPIQPPGCCWRGPRPHRRSVRSCSSRPKRSPSRPPRRTRSLIPDAPHPRRCQRAPDRITYGPRDNSARSFALHAATARPSPSAASRLLAAWGGTDCAIRPGSRDENRP